MERRDFLLGFSATGAGAVASTQVAAAEDADALAAKGIKVVSTMADLRAQKPKSDDIIWLRGHRRPNDGGEGFFHWDAESKDADNGGTIIAPNGGGSGRWLRAHANSFVNAKWFPNPADAIAYGNARGKASENTVVYFPSLPYSKFYDIGKVTVDTRVGLCGDGERSRISGNITFVGGARNLSSPIRDLRFENAVTIQECRHRLFENVQFMDTTIFPDRGQSYYNTFLHCQWMLVATAIECGPVNNFNRVMNCRVFMRKDATSAGIRIVDSDGWVVDATAIEIERDRSTPYPPFIDLGGDAHTVSGCWFERAYSAPFKDPGIILRGNGNYLQLGSMGHWMPISDLGRRNKITGSIRRTSATESVRDNLAAEWRGLDKVKPDAKGNTRIKHRLFRTPAMAHVSVKGNATRLAHYMSADDVYLEVRITDLAGQPVSDRSYEIAWLAIV